MADYSSCTNVSPQCPISATVYGYYPVLSVNAFFAALFGTLTILALALGIRSRTQTYTIALTIGALLETSGYIGRILMHSNPWDSAGFQLQIITLILAPSFVAASIYVCLKHLIIYRGAQHSRIQPKWYPRAFIGCDIGSICLQAIGGGTAAAGGTTNISLQNVGNNLMIAGIAFQVFTMACCGLLMLDYIIRLRRAESDGPYHDVDKLNKGKDPKFRVFCIALGLAYITILIRCIYRLPEMAGGWGNPLMQKETEFLLLDGMMVAVAITSLTLVHPGTFFPSMRGSAKKAAASQHELSDQTSLDTDDKGN